MNSISDRLLSPEGDIIYGEIDSQTGYVSFYLKEQGIYSLIKKENTTVTSTEPFVSDTAVTTYETRGQKERDPDESNSGGTDSKPYSDSPATALVIGGISLSAAAAVFVFLRFKRTKKS